MKKLFLIITLLGLLFPLVHSYGQEVVKPFTARAYWLEEQDPSYRSIITKVNQGSVLSDSEKEYLDFYEQHLKDYFERLSEEEKERYRIYKSQWDEELQVQAESEPSDILEENARGINPGKKYKLYNGLYGYIYGAMAVPILGLEDANASIALPFITAGASLLLPVINPTKYQNMTYNSVLLNRHGKFFGLVDGAALGLLAFGTEGDNAEVPILALSIAGSIGLGELGFQLGKSVDWTEGRIVGYTHYAAVSPLVTMGIYAAFLDVDEDFNSRLVGGLVLLSEASGYLLADALWKKYNYTRGDMLTSSSFTILSALFGLGLVGEIETDDDQKEILIPTLTFLAGSLGSHAILKGRYLTVKNGWRVNYVAGAGAILGLGVSLAINSDNMSTYFLIPSIGGFIGWASMLGTVSKRQQLQGNNSSVRFSYDFQPQNYFINKERSNSYFNPETPGASVINLRLRF
jgi:hypothetical protein